MSDEDERERRLRALRELAQEGGTPSTRPPTPTGTGTTAANATSLMTSRGTRKPRWRIVAALLALVVVIVGVGAGVVLHGRGGILLGSTAPKLVTIRLGPTNLACLDENGSIAWSPNASQLALLGYYQSCGGAYLEGGNSVPGLLSVYDSATGRLRTTIHPEDLILSQVSPHLPASVTAYLNAQRIPVSSILAFAYSAVMWSPNGTRLAVPFLFWEPTAPPSVPPGSPAGEQPYWNQGQTYTGLLLLAPDGTDPHVYLAPTVLKNLELFQPLTPTEWNLSTGAQVPLPSAVANSESATGSTPPAAVAWGANGQLHVLPATSANLAYTPIGNPAGSQQVSIWQPGALYPNLTFPPFNPTTQNQPPPTWDGTFSWSSTINTWSPDGNYLLTNLYIRRPVPPVRDGALMQALSTLTRIGYQGDPENLSDTLAWRPDGGVLAVWHNNAPTRAERDTGNLTSETVTFYDTSGGAQIGTLTPSTAGQSPEQYYSEVLSWAPDGSRLAFVDEEGTLTIWGPGSLPTT